MRFHLSKCSMSVLFFRKTGSIHQAYLQGEKLGFISATMNLSPDAATGTFFTKALRPSKAFSR